uniref:Oligomycin sensitivity conferral protein n=1 Tax=Ceratosolen solmsi TaxID=142686 RepID=A0A0A1CQ30_9HYME|nr:mitochondrial oligomycin sensitivity conferral protein [Ceratosolen solmsi]
MASSGIGIIPPIQVFGLNGRYATALYSAASKQKSLDTVEKDLLKFQQLLKTDKKLIEFIKDPSIKRKVKSDILHQTKFNFNPATINFLKLLAENGRLASATQIVNIFKIIMAASRGEVVCEVITASPLDGDNKSKLEKALKSYLKKGQTIVLTTKIDPSIIGGLIISIGDKYVDMSVASKLKKYTEALNQAI